MMNCEHCGHKIEPKKKVLCKSCSSKARKRFGLDKKRPSVCHRLPESHQKVTLQAIRNRITFYCRKKGRLSNIKCEELYETLCFRVFLKIFNPKQESKNRCELEQITNTLSKISPDRCAEWFVNEYATDYYLQQREIDNHRSNPENHLKEGAKKGDPINELKSDSDNESDSEPRDIFSNSSFTPLKDLLQKEGKNNTTNALILLLERHDNAFFLLTQFIKHYDLDLYEFIRSRWERKKIVEYFSKHDTRGQWNPNAVTKLKKRLYRFIDNLEKEYQNEKDLFEHLKDVFRKNKEGYYGLNILLMSNYDFIENQNDCISVMQYMQEHHYNLYALINKEKQWSRQEIQKITEDLLYLNYMEFCCLERVTKVLENVNALIAYRKNRTGTRIEKEEHFAEYLINVYYYSKKKNGLFSGNR